MFHGPLLVTQAEEFEKDFDPCSNIPFIGLSVYRFQGGPGFATQFASWPELDGREAYLAETSEPGNGDSGPKRRTACHPACLLYVIRGPWFVGNNGH